MTKSTCAFRDSAPSRRLPARAGAVLALIVTLAACARAEGTDQSRVAKTSPPPATAVTQPATELTPDQRKYYREMAALAWKYFERNNHPATGYVNATPNWQNTTLWDIGAQILAVYSAKELGLITPAVYRRRMTKTLVSLEKAALFRNIAYNRIYSTSTGLPGSSGGWSATDLGRFLIALKVLAVRDPQFAPQAERIAKRNDFSKIVYDGYLHGQLQRASGPFSFQEGRIGYEQYVAMGFKLWGAQVEPALNFEANGEPVSVLGVPLLADKRYTDRLLSEPFILYGLELGLEGAYRKLAESVLKVQEERYKTTGKMTIMTEDAVSEPPDYFYYYCVYCNRKPFVVDISSPGKERDQPRWVSTKGAFGWDALMPSDYTRLATKAVAPAKDMTHGWASGIYESTGLSTKTVDINTSAVLLEIAFYQLRGGRPLIEPATVKLR